MNKSPASNRLGIEAQVRLQHFSPGLHFLAAAAGFGGGGGGAGLGAGGGFGAACGFGGGGGGLGAGAGGFGAAAGLGAGGGGVARFCSTLGSGLAAGLASGFASILGWPVEVTGFSDFGVGLAAVDGDGDGDGVIAGFFAFSRRFSFVSDVGSVCASGGFSGVEDVEFVPFCCRLVPVPC